MLISCGPDNRVSLAEKLMAERETDSAITVMNEIKEPVHNLSKRDYALYALLMSEAVHRKQQLNAATDTLLLPAIKYFSQSGDSLYAERALYCKAHLDRRLNRMSDAMQSFLKALLFLQNSGNHEQLYRVNTWLGVVCLNQEEYSGKVRYSKEALKAALDLGNMFYKNMALCDISTGYLFLNQLDSALYYAQAAYEAALADSVPRQLPFIYTNLGSIYSQQGEPAKALDYINKHFEEQLKACELAELCNMSETHFRRLFESFINMPPMEYVNLIRVQKACELMKKSNESMDLIAQKCGFTTPSTFNRNFRKFVGTSPYQWKINPENYEHKLLNFRISALKGW